MGNETIAAELEETGDSLFDGEFLFDNIEDHSNYTNSSLTNLTEQFLLRNQMDTRDVAMMFRAWTDGFLTPVMGSFGILGNVASVLVFSQMKRTCFDDLLCGLAVFDLMFIIFGGFSLYGRSYLRQYSVFKMLLPYFLHPFRFFSYDLMLQTSFNC